MKSAYQPDVIEDIIAKRIARVDTILKSRSEIAVETTEIFIEAAKRNLDCLAPNHIADGFRDTVNILTLLAYLRSKGYTESCFCTSNHSDFSAEKANKQELHPHLAELFREAGLEYVYCDDVPFGAKLLNAILRPKLPSFQAYLKERKRLQEENDLQARKAFESPAISNPDADFIENIQHIDRILAKPVRTRVDEDILGMLINRHESYKQYFLRNVGNDGMV